MITLFNREELILTDDMEMLYEIRTLLANHQIEYKEARTGMLPVNRTVNN